VKAERRLQSSTRWSRSRCSPGEPDVITATNAIHIYHDLPDTLTSWTRILKPGGLALICSANMNNPGCRFGDWSIDETVARVNEIVAGKIEAHRRMCEKVFVPVRPLEFYTDTFADCGLTCCTSSTRRSSRASTSGAGCSRPTTRASSAGSTARRGWRATSPAPRRCATGCSLIRYGLERLSGAWHEDDNLVSVVRILGRC
jgi:hypothetical protein